MRIALLTAEYPPQPGGVGDYTRCLARALTGGGHDLWVVTGDAGQGQQPAPGRSQPGSQEPGVQVLRQVRAWDWRCWDDTIAALDQVRPDVVHIQYQTGAYGMHPAINLLPWRLRGLPQRPRVVVTLHDLLEPYLFPKAGWVRRWVTLRLAQDVDRVIVTNAEDAAALRRASRRALMRCVLVPQVIPIGTNIPVAPPAGYERAAWRAALGIRPDTWLVAYFGLLAWSKGVDVLLDALALLVEQGSASAPVRLLLIGGAATTPQDRAYADEFFARLERSGLQPHVICTGHVDAAVVSAHLLASDVVALPFRQGASFRSGSLIAALTHGAAVVTTTTGRAAETPGAPDATPRLVDGEQGLLVPAGDSQALARALQQVRENATLRTRLRQGGQAVGQHFSWARIVQQHDQVYRQLALASRY